MFAVLRGPQTGLNGLTLPLRWREREAFAKAKDQIASLEPWYQPIWFDWGLRTIPRTKEGRTVALLGRDRGWLKWKLFIERNLPFPLRNKRVLDVGCNAGYFLIKSIEKGAKEAIGIEVDDHYFKQATFATGLCSQIQGRALPIRLFQCAMESFDFSRVGPVDLTFFLNSIYHVGKVKGIFTGSAVQIHDRQVETLRNVSRYSEFMCFEANPIRDEGNGKGKGSLHKLIGDAGLSIYSSYEAFPKHERGYILIAHRKSA